MTGRREQERSRTTRLRLMRATAECLVELGWSGTTTTAVSERAGVSRGAQLHHYPTRAELVVAAVEHVAVARTEELLRTADTLPRDGRRTLAVLELLAELYTGPLFEAAVELWVAARTDPQLHAVVMPLEDRLGREGYRLALELLGVDDTRAEIRDAVGATLDLVRGFGLANLLSDDRSRRSRLLRQWAAMLDAVLAEPAPGRDREPPTGAGSGTSVPV
ncbi:TetR family transcriptional regulator [Longispora fulva]|uniref:AcrR family transcriptional regulator n=1 Tax=Longispora fulva TaxID=619741 RepID=A0A8J7KJX6_9ACTN|nr:TetR/AcrR family transcriptional regulator [Longispora fulva]MBG6137374.1 AcrR family transcriptional regulator [Longispora fulva]GIG61272.1 TetR family transcriptional regulator [Longispora fulva]